MKLLHKILGVGTLGLAIALPLANQTPVMAGFPQIKEAIAQVAKKPTVKLNLTAAKKFIVDSVGGKKQVQWDALTENSIVNPGDVLRYTVSSNNTGVTPAKDLTITQPIPDRMTYKVDTASSKNQAAITYSTDNGETFVAEPKISIEMENGKTIKQPAPAETYTHIRWQFDSLSPETAITAMYDVEVQ